MPRVSRRDLAKSAWAGAALLKAQVGPAPVKYSGPLDGFESRVKTVDFDPVAFTMARHQTAPLRMTFRAADRTAALRWQQQLRAKVAELLGAFPSARTALQPQTLEVRDFPTYRREKFVFQSRPGVTVLGYLLTPKGAPAPHPALICLPGHGRGVDDIVAIDKEGRDRTVREGYSYDFAVQAVELGVAVVAIELMGFGCRRDAATKQKGLDVSACHPPSGSALLLGETMLSWRTYDVMRTIDWIETRKELNAGRVGCVGISGGGMCALYTAALEPRLRATMISCALNTYRDSIMAMSHCIDNYVPGILNWAEMYDVAGLIAPRALFAEAGEKDNIFPLAASRASFDRVKRIYEVFGAPEMFATEFFDGPHAFWGKRGLPFLAAHLKRS